MCYYTSVKTTGRQLAADLHAPFERADQFTGIVRANGFSHPELPVLSVDNGRSINMYNWGLIPHWVKDWESAVKLRRQTLNCISEEVFEKPSFRDSIMKRRCIIPVTGFFEWKHVGKSKFPYFIHPKEQPYFYLMCLYSFWTDPATRDVLPTFTILTGAANVLMADIHNTKKRQPLMIDKRNIDAWMSLDLPKSGVIELMQPCDDREMAAYTIAGGTDNSNDDHILEQVNYGSLHN
ncbi:SOS response-associated peptidase [Pedobacter faecalis]|uniref:SOS response-associated peptidase n=1 Tax=Pedobacter faecalis TaxID=3041495 RepID=UPI00254AD697|nr:SOS response-associated peptidase [Pedobacter sp. ELA7]